MGLEEGKRVGGMSELEIVEKRGQRVERKIEWFRKRRTRKGRREEGRT